MLRIVGFHYTFFIQRVSSNLYSPLPPPQLSSMTTFHPHGFYTLEAQYYACLFLKFMPEVHPKSQKHNQYK